MKYGYSIVLLLSILLLNACGSHIYHTVRPGETLYSVSWRYGYDYKEVAKWNNIHAPYIIKKGQRLRLAPSVSGHSLPASGYGNASKPSKPTVVAKQVTPIVAPSKSAKVVKPTTSVSQAKTQWVGNKKLVWQWPIQGKILRQFSKKMGGSRGLDITAKRGSPIRATSSGRVVYSGQGLARYGNLLIIKHNEQFLSAYAHNDQLLVKEGDSVKKGQVIARMGSTGTDRVKLHFEIRKNGKPVNPRRYLPLIKK